MAGELLWWAGTDATGSGAAPPLAVAAYFLAPVLALPAMLLLAREGGRLTGRTDAALRHSTVTTVLDGIVAALAFSILVYIAFGAKTDVALPRSGNTTIVIAYSLTELIVVVSGALMAMVYRPDRPYRANFLLLSLGIVIIAASDRMVAYLHTIGAESGDLWGGIGFALGPLMIMSAVLERRSRPASARSEDAMDWAQLILPYAGFLGIAGLFAFHILIGHELNAFLVSTTVVMVLLVAARQVVALRAQRLLNRQLFETQGRLAHQVNHDPLTGLPNRLLLAKRLDAAMRDGRFVLTSSISTTSKRSTTATVTQAATNCFAPSASD